MFCPSTFTDKLSSTVGYAVKIEEQFLPGQYIYNGQRAICMAIIKQADSQLLNLEKEITGDIVQGLPRIEEILEARKKNQVVKRIPTSQKKGLLTQRTSLDENFEFHKLGTPIKENEKIYLHSGRCFTIVCTVILYRGTYTVAFVSGNN